MMTKKSTQKANLRILWAIPMAILVFIVLSAFNPLREKESQNTKAGSGLNLEAGQQQESNSEALVVVSPVKMNVLYLGVDNPVSIAISGVLSENLRVQINNGTITGSAGNYVVVPQKTGIAEISVFNKDEKVGTTMFRVKTIPDPIATVAGKKGGPISKNAILSEPRVDVILENFDFDLSFEVVEFTVAANIKGFEKMYSSKGSSFSDEQIALIKKLQKGNKVYIEGIVAKGPDGIPRKMQAISFLISD